jgi:rifampin ADP-ribosylating transferase
VDLLTDQLGQLSIELAAWEHELRGPHGEWTRGGTGTIERVTHSIGDEGARGNSRAVSEAEFQQLAAEGRDRLRAIQGAPWGTAGLQHNWPAVKERTYAEVQKSWGGATVDPRTGEDLPQGADKFAMSVKPTGMDTTSIPEHASREQFSQAMDVAWAKYSNQLAKGGSYLGIFHDDDLHRIDIDPVTVLDNMREVETIGAWTHAIGGAYRFSDGNGYWPPHVPSSAQLANSNHHWAGPGQWHSQAVQIQQPHDDDAGPPTLGGEAMTMAFDPAEPRGPGGRWMSWERPTIPDRITGEPRPVQLFHGTRRSLKPGDLVTTASSRGSESEHGGDSEEAEHTYFTSSPWYAADFPTKFRASDEGTPHVYEVEPTGEYEIDPHDKALSQGQAYRSQHPIRVTREIPPLNVFTPQQLRGKTASVVEDGQGNKFLVWEYGGRWMGESPSGSRFFAHSKAEAARLIRETGGRYDDQMPQADLSTCPGCGCPQDSITGQIELAFDPAEPRGKGGEWIGLDAKDYEGTTGDRSHITRTEHGQIPLSAIAHLPGADGERPGEHRSKQGQAWEQFKQDIAANGIKNPVFITVDHGRDPVISEGNHRRDAAAELGLAHVPALVQYFGHAEKQGTVIERAGHLAGTISSQL